MIELVVYSNGTFSLAEVWHMPFDEREMAVKILNDYNRVKSGKQPTDWM